MHPLYKKSDALTADVIGAAIEVQKYFGVGLLESIYVKALRYELETRGHSVKSEFPVDIIYKGNVFEEKLRVDLLVDDCLVVEAKARNCTQKEIESFKAQTLSYLKLLNKPLGLVINFNVEQVGKYGTNRVILEGADKVELESDRARGIDIEDGDSCRDAKSATLRTLRSESIERGNVESALEAEK